MITSMLFKYTQYGYQIKALSVRKKLVLVQCSYINQFQSYSISKTVKLVAISYLSMHKESTLQSCLQALTPSPASFLATTVNEFMTRLDGSGGCVHRAR